MRFLNSLVVEISFPSFVPNHFISWHFHNLSLVLNPNVSFLTTYIHNPSFYNLLFGIIFLCQHFWGFSGGEKNVDSKPGTNSLAGYHFPLAISSLRQSRGWGVGHKLPISKVEAGISLKSFFSFSSNSYRLGCFPRIPGFLLLKNICC